MTLRSASATSTTTSATTTRTTGPAHATRPTTRARSAPPGAPTLLRADESALDEALEHIGQLAERLWAVRRLHVPARRRALSPPGARVRCAGCGQEMPCPTLQAAAA